MRQKRRGGRGREEFTKHNISHQSLTGLNEEMGQPMTLCRFLKRKEDERKEKKEKKEKKRKRKKKRKEKKRKEKKRKEKKRKEKKRKEKKRKEKKKKRRRKKNLLPALVVHPTRQQSFYSLPTGPKA